MYFIFIYPPYYSYFIMLLLFDIEFHLLNTLKKVV